MSFTFQNEDRIINQRVFNMIEFHLSQQETDSIYHLAAPEFKQAVSYDNFKSLLSTQIYPMGRIIRASQVEFDAPKKLGKYRVDFENLTLQILLSVNADRKFNTLLIQAYTPTREESLPVIRSVSKGEKIGALTQELANAYIRKPQTKALAIGILSPSGNQTYYFGQKSRLDTQKPTANSLFEIGSITKTITAGILASIVQSGQIQLDDYIIEYLPDSLKNIPGLQKITFKNLANHTSGLPRLPDNLSQSQGFQNENPYMLYDEAALFQFLKSRTQVAEEYHDYEYSNLGYGLLGILLEKVSGHPYSLLVESFITNPLEMSQTFVQSKEGTDLLPVHTAEGKTTPTWDFKAIQAAGAIKSSLSDMMKYASAHIRTPHSDLENAFADTRQFTFFIPPDTDIGLGWHIQMLGDQTIYWHNGGTGGSRSYIGLCPDKNTAVIVLSNCNESVDAIGISLLESLTQIKL